jgi:hypothetical protein
MCPLIHSKDRLVQVCACSASDAINTLTWWTNVDRRK